MFILDRPSAPKRYNVQGFRIEKINIAPRDLKDMQSIEAQLSKLLLIIYSQFNLLEQFN